MPYPTDLKPTSRSFSAGDYPVKAFKSQSGVETRILYGNSRTDVKLQLSYDNIGDASAELFLDHFDETKGTFSTFDLPVESLAGWSGNTDALRPEATTVEVVTLVVTVVSSGGSNKYRINGSSADNETLTLSEGTAYLFVQSDASNSGHPLRLSTTSDGTHGGGSQYTTNVTTFGTAGSTGAYTRIKIAADAPTLYYYCVSHSGMGGQINTPAGAASSESGTPATYRYESAPQLTQVRPGVSTVTVNLIGVL